jgi:hypothetical protein
LTIILGKYIFQFVSLLNEYGVTTPCDSVHFVVSGMAQTAWYTVCVSFFKAGSKPHQSSVCTHSTSVLRLRLALDWAVELPLRSR